MGITSGVVGETVASLTPTPPTNLEENNNDNTLICHKHFILIKSELNNKNLQYN